MSASHTPGPWIVDPVSKLDVRASDGKDVAISLCREMSGIDIVDFSTVGPLSRDEAFANARLISAAPELLAALERAAQWMNENNTNESPSTNCDALLEEIRFAISKARP